MSGAALLYTDLGLFITTGPLALVLRWWGLWLGLGLVFAPLGAVIFRQFPDRGYASGRILGLVLAAYLTWLAAATGVAGFGRTSAIFSLTAVAMVSWAAWLLLGRQSRWPLTTIRTVLTHETIFLACLVGWSFVRSLDPALHSLEKMMDFGFINACLHSPTMPPPDMWWAGGTINYYYFGHFVCAWLIRLASVAPEIGYNLLVATIMGTTASQAYSFASGLAQASGRLEWSRCRLAGSISALLLTLGGTLHTFVFGVIGRALYALGCRGNGLGQYGYPQATRYIGFNPPAHDKTITEFPAYSFIVSDLHAHVLSLPLALTFLALMLAFFVSVWGTSQAPPQAGARWPGRLHLLLGGVLLGLLYMTNSWALPIYLLLAVACVWVAYRRRDEPLSRRQMICLLVPMGVLAAGVLLPFQADFAPFSKGVRLVAHATPVYQLMVLWGYQAFLLGWYWIGLKGADGRRRLTVSDAFTATVAVVAVALIAIPELIFVKDIYGGDYLRANTMFKLTYEAFSMLALLVGYAAVMIASRPRPPWRRLGVNLTLTATLYAPLLFMCVALLQAYDLQPPRQYRGLDGLAYLDTVEPGARAAAAWLRQHAPAGAAILEADGDSYSDSGRISELSSFPTVLGWYVHEVLWRGNEGAVDQRQAQVRRAYEAKSAPQASTVLRHYGVRYVVLGTVERKRFPALEPRVLHALGPVVFREGEVEIIAVAPGWLRQAPQSSGPPLLVVPATGADPSPLPSWEATTTGIHGSPPDHQTVP